LLGLASIAPAQAGVATFDDVGPDIYIGNTDFSSGGFQFTATSGFTEPGGLVGVIDTPEGFAFGNAPTNALDQFYAGLNDGGLTMTAGRFDLTLKGFEFGFIPAVPFFFDEGYVPGLLVAFYTTAAGVDGYESFEFSGADADGLFAFSSVGSQDLGALGQALSSVTFLACLYDGDQCYLDAFNQAQFAIDNISASVPEPGSLALLVLGLGLTGRAARRRAVR
jgi:hypothetical protein